MREFILFVLIIVLGTSGEMCVSRTMKTVGEVKDFRPAAIARVILRALRVGWMWIGVGMMAVAFFSLLGALSLENVSFVVPVSALGYLVGACGGKFFLGERVTSQRWLGVFLVVIGVTLVMLSRR
ncbi:MAG TPA: EamA family transporter [Acidobacteriaceae bacterium]|nr:EamA family transporter [Acidobacteriaceae bacterium]